MKYLAIVLMLIYFSGCGDDSAPVVEETAQDNHIEEGLKNLKEVQLPEYKIICRQLMPNTEASEFEAKWALIERQTLIDYTDCNTTVWKPMSECWVYTMNKLTYTVDLECHELGGL